MQGNRNGLQKVLVASAICGGAGVGLYFYYRNYVGKQNKPQRSFTLVYADNSDDQFRHVVVDEHGNEIKGLEMEYNGMHPYKDVIENVKPCVPRSALDVPIKPPPLDRVPCVWVNDVEQLHGLIKELLTLERFAVDTEHHKHHTYQGFICLIQIFTGEKTFLIDAITLHDHLHSLNEVFANKEIRKVVHGCHNDVLWLQRDFRIYLVNAFDTEKACQVLGKPTRNLAHLLWTYLTITTDKSFQVADWRHRPLSQKQIQYARMDVHYLLYLEDVLTQELLQKDNLINDIGSLMSDQLMLAGNSCPSYDLAIRKSQDVCLHLFYKMTSKESATASALHILKKNMDVLNVHNNNGGGEVGPQGPGRKEEDIVRDCVYYLCVWRDGVARKEDESCECILKNRVLAKIACNHPENATELLKFASTTPFYELDAGEADGPMEPKYWTPSKAFKAQAGKIAELIQGVVSGELEWIEGASLLEKASKAAKKMTPEEKEEARKKLVEVFSAKSKVYDNCMMLSMEGDLLCYCDRRRLEWYVRKGLAEKLKDEPFTIQLNFQHRLTDERNGVHDFYVQSRKNRCVVCGEAGHYLRYKVVPACYRKNFPVHLKSHRSHDIVLLCVDCHHKAQKAADSLKKVIAEEYGIPLNLYMVQPEAQSDMEAKDEDSQFCEESQQKQVSVFKVRGAAVAIQRHGDAIPDDRRRQLENVIHTFFGRNAEQESGLRPGDLERALQAGLGRKKLKRLLKSQENQDEESGDLDECSVEVPSTSRNDRLKDGGQMWHGDKVIQLIMETGGESEIHDLVRRFRKVFVDALNPKYLPERWEVSHFAPRDFGEYSIFHTESKQEETAASDNEHGMKIHMNPGHDMSSE